MIRLVFALVTLALVACTPKPAPVAPSSPPENAAIEFARTKDADVRCIAWPSSPTAPDVAFCDFGQVLAYCRVGVGAGSECKLLVDYPAAEKAAADQARARAKQEADAKAKAEADAKAAADKAKTDPPKKPEKK
jgi:hypothetical protein